MVVPVTMPVGTIVIDGKLVATDCPRLTVDPIIGPIGFDVVSESIAFVAKSAPWNVALTSWIESPLGTWPLRAPSPFAAIIISTWFGFHCEFGAQPLPLASTTAQRYEFLIRKVPER